MAHGDLDGAERIEQHAGERIEHVARAQGDRVRGDVLAGAAQVLAAPRLGT